MSIHSSGMLVAIDVHLIAFHIFCAPSTRSYNMWCLSNLLVKIHQRRWQIAYKRDSGALNMQCNEIRRENNKQNECNSILCNNNNKCSSMSVYLYIARGQWAFSLLSLHISNSVIIKTLNRYISIEMEMEMKYNNKHKFIYSQTA